MTITSPAIRSDSTFRRLASDDSPDLQTVTSVEGVFRYASAASITLFGWDPSHLVGRHQDAFSHPDDVELLDQARREMAQAPGCPVTTWYRFLCANGLYQWTETVSTLVFEADERLVVSAVRDIGDRKTAQLDLEHMARIDALTGVANRSVFMDRLQQALRRLDRQDRIVTVLFLDLDRFKLINDSVGHLIGDAVLVALAERLKLELRSQDTLARWGGDEFAVVVEGMASQEEAVELGRRIIDACRRPFVVGEEQLICTTSLGVAVTADPGHSPEDLLQEADMALYRAKDRGRDRAEVFDEGLRTRAIGRLGTERMLRRAISENRLRVTYQPIIDLATGDTVAAEALVRVWDPDMPTLIPAESFIEVAEESGLLGPMDDWVLGETIEQVARWNRLFLGTEFADVAINVTARRLADAGFAESVIEDLAGHGLSTSVLQIEVTERVLMEASNSAMTGLRLLREAGIKVGLDDFGTGYSSLSYLRQFPLDFVKIDGSFIHKLAVGTSERPIVASIIDLSHALGMEVVAEGVETRTQLEALIDLGCDRAQGFLFAGADTPEHFEDRLLGASY